MSAAIDLSASDRVGEDLRDPRCNDQTNPCDPGMRCYKGVCLVDNGTCTKDEDCQNDTWCGDTAACIPYGYGARPMSHDPACKIPAFQPFTFESPVERCRFSGVVPGPATPLVIDVTGDGLPEVVFAGTDSGGANRLVAFRGGDCTEVANVEVADHRLCSALAAADVDGDGYPEIVSLSIVSANPWRSSINLWSAPSLALNSRSSAAAGSGRTNDYAGSSLPSTECSAPAIAQLIPGDLTEIAVGGTMFRYRPTNGDDWTNGFITSYATAPTLGTLTAIVDVNDDGVNDLVVGKEIFTLKSGTTSGDLVNITPTALKNLAGAGGYPALGDFTSPPDGKPDLVLVQSERGAAMVLSIFDLANNQFLMGPIQVQGGKAGGPPTLADFDGDGRLDVGVATDGYFYVFSSRCDVTMNRPVDCTGDDRGVLWRKPIRNVSGGSAAAAFDLNGDGRLDVALRDECWLRIYDGRTGRVQSAMPLSGTGALEQPVVADVDADGHADLVVVSDRGGQSAGRCNGAMEADTGMAFPVNGYTAGVFVLRDPTNRWLGTRPLWSEASYHVRNINDDLTVPDVEDATYSPTAGFRVNTASAPSPEVKQTDLVAAPAGAMGNGDAGACPGRERLYAKVCNRGTAEAAAGVPGTFYLGDPRGAGAVLLCTTTTRGALASAGCEVVSCDWSNATMPADVYFRINDDGRLLGTGECRSGNNLLVLKGQACP